MKKVKSILKYSMLFLLSLSMIMGNLGIGAYAAEKQGVKIKPTIVDLGEFSTQNSDGISMFTAQNATIDLKDGNYEKWIDRIVIPDYGIQLYNTLVEYTDNDGVNDLFISNDGFSKSTAYKIDYGIGIDTFNAIKVVNLNNLSNNEINYVYKLIRAVYDAFVMDHPEVFWLSGKTSSYLVQYSYPNGTISYEFYMLLKMHEGSYSDPYDDFLAEQYSTETLICEAISQRDQAIEKILNTPAVKNAKNDYEVVKAFNEWLTKNNEYNTLVLNGDPYGTFDSHNCMSALIGREGTEGPVCESYTEALMVLCNRKGIPCVHVTGRATASPGSAGEAHSWNYVKIGNAWYGVDSTWNDPAVNGISGKESGYENENYFLIGSKTQNYSMNFEDSHKLQNTVSSGEPLAFTNGPVLAENAYQYGAPEVPKTYTISWDINGDGIVDETSVYEEGQMPVHADGVTPEDANYTYTFNGWDPEIAPVTGDQTYTAKFTAIKKPDVTPPEAPKHSKNPVINESSIDFEWKPSTSDDVVKYEVFNVDTNEVLKVVTDTKATITGLDVNTNYNIGIRAVDEAGNKSQALIYTVMIEKTIFYTISWDTDGDGTVDETAEYEAGQMPAHADGYKPADEKYEYIFKGWNPAIKAITGDQTYTAQFEAKEIVTEPEIPVDPIEPEKPVEPDEPVDPKPPVEPEKPKMDEVVRLSGSTRYDTGYEVANALKEVLGIEKFEAVVIATGKNFADALAGSYLAVEKNAPILLTNGKDDNIAQLHAYIKENVVENGMIYILGGEGAVPSSVDQIDGYVVKRLYGSSRYDTNIQILKEAGVSGDSIIVATGKTFADSLSASAAKLPILLVKPNGTLNDAQTEILDEMKNIYIVGGEGAVSKEYAEALEAYGTVTRVSGASRYDTSVEIAKAFCLDVDTAVIASGKNFPDGLCGGPLAAALNAPLILTKDGGAEAATAYVTEKSINGGYVLGGSGALADRTVVDVFSLKNADAIK